MVIPLFAEHLKAFIGSLFSLQGKGGFFEYLVLCKICVLGNQSTWESGRWRFKKTLNDPSFQFATRITRTFNLFYINVFLCTDFEHGWQLYTLVSYLLTMYYEKNVRQPAVLLFRKLLIKLCIIFLCVYVGLCEIKYFVIRDGLNITDTGFSPWPAFSFQGPVRANNRWFSQANNKENKQQDFLIFKEYSEPAKSHWIYATIRFHSIFFM